MGMKQAGWLSHYVNAVVKRPCLDTGLYLLRHYSAYAWKLTTEKSLRWCHTVLPMQNMMEVEGKDLPFCDKRKTYDNMKMDYHRRFYLRLESMCWSEEGTRVAQEQCMFPFAQVKEPKKIVADVGKDVMLSALDYDGRGRDIVAGYSLHETKNEVEEKGKECIRTSERNRTVVVSTSNML